MDEVLIIRVRDEPGHTITTVAGEIDIATVGRLRTRLAWLAAAGRPLVLDLDLVTFIEAAGLNVLAGAARRAAARRSSLHVASSREQLWRLTRITGLDDQVLLARTLGEALAALPSARPMPAAGTPRETRRQERGSA